MEREKRLLKGRQKSIRIKLIRTDVIRKQIKMRKQKQRGK